MKNLIIKVGDYVRTKYGIAKVEKDRRIQFGLMHPVIDILKKEAIIKSSPKIIDLIEVGDYVNGDRIDSIETTDKGIKIFVHEAMYQDSNIYYWDKDILSIVTKEQFEAMEYEIER